MINMFITNDMYLLFYFYCTSQNLLCVYPVWFHSHCDLGDSLIFFLFHIGIRGSFKKGKTSYMLDVDICDLPMARH